MDTKARCFAAFHCVATAGGGSAPVLRLQAEKKVFSRQAVSEITPADAAARLVCMSEEGQVGDWGSLYCMYVLALSTFCMHIE